MIKRRRVLSLFELNSGITKLLDDHFYFHIFYRQNLIQWQALLHFNQIAISQWPNEGVGESSK